jgi:TfoX/Sxy family transcriptional regulator of competence genes
MAYDELLADRIRQAYRERHIAYSEKKMMGGVCFLVNDKMCVGIVKNKLMVRIDPEKHTEALERKGCHEMDFTGKPMKGFVFVEPDGIDMDMDLSEWIDLAMEYNPLAKSGKKKKTKI